MNARVLHEANGAQTWVLIFDTGDEFPHPLVSFAHDNAIDAAHFTAIGAFSDVSLGWYDLEAQGYRSTHIDGQVEVVALSGDIAASDDGPVVHAHVVVADYTALTRGGHLLDAHVRPTLEVVLTETPAHLKRRHDPTSGLALIDLDQSSDGP